MGRTGGKAPSMGGTAYRILGTRQLARLLAGGPSSWGLWRRVGSMGGTLDGPWGSLWARPQQRGGGICQP